MKINIKLNLFLLIILLGVGFFGFEEDIKADEKKIIIVEIYPYPKSGSEEFVKIKNVSDEKINLSGWKIIDNVNLASHKYEFPNGTEIEAGEIIFIERNFFLNNSGLDIIYLFDNLTDIKEKDSAIDRVEYLGAKENYSYVFNGENWEWKFKSEEDEEEEEVPEPEPELEPEPEPEELIDYSGKIILNEIFPYPESGKKEFIELKNISDEKVDITGWRIEDSKKQKRELFKNQKKEIEAGGIVSEEGNFYLNNDHEDDNDFDDIVYLLDKNGSIVDEVKYFGAQKNYSYSFDGVNWFWTSDFTPDEENKFDEIENSDEDEEGEKENNFEKSKYRIRLNEILPNPKGEESEKEYVEIFSDEEEEINLEDWVLKDSSTKKFIFSDDYIIKPESYLAIYRDKFKFALNNTGREEVFLFDEEGNLASSVSYEKSAKENVSYNFDDEKWRWSKKLTPNEKNEFSSVPKIKIEKIKSGFVGMPIFFSAKVDYKKKKDLKYRWDFGDGRKSYLQDTSHIFQEKGKYKVIFSVDNRVEEIVKSFSIEIKKYPKADVSIESLSPNPIGNDTGNEWIEVKNNSDKKVNLKGWKIATGEKTLINHPINEDFSVSSKESVKISRKTSLFYLNNKKATVELRYPNGKTADKVKYKKEKIKEGEICQNVKGNCVWILTGKEKEEIENTPASEPEETIDGNTLDENLEEKNLQDNEDNDEHEEKLSHYSFPEEFPIKTVVKKIPIYQIENEYYFIRPTNQNHWASELLDDIETEIFSFFYLKNCLLRQF